MCCNAGTTSILDSGDTKIGPVESRLSHERWLASNHPQPDDVTAGYTILQWGVKERFVTIKSCPLREKKKGSQCSVLLFFLFFEQTSFVFVCDR